MIIGAAAGIGVAALGAAVLIATWSGLRRLLDVRNRMAWDAEWAEVEPVWSGRGHRS
jgi:hypothetical protein